MDFFKKKGLNPQDHILLDAGAGRGDACVTMAYLFKGGRVVGVEIAQDPFAVSLAAQNKILTTYPSAGFNLFFYHFNLAHMIDLNPVTHVYAFVGSPEHMHQTLWLAARSSTVLWVVFTSPKMDYLNAVGIGKGDPFYIPLGSSKMASNCSYPTVALEMTPEAKTRIQANLTHLGEAPKTAFSLEDLLSKHADSAAYKKYAKREIKKWYDAKPDRTTAGKRKPTLSDSQREEEVLNE